VAAAAYVPVDAMSGFRVFRGIVLVAFGAFFLLPLLAMADFSTQAKGDATGRTLDAWKVLVQDEDLRSAIISSLLLAVLTVVLMVVLLVPTMIWVRLRVPKMSRVVEFLCLLPLTIPALVIVVGISGVYAWVNYLLGDSPLTLAFAYTVLVLPYAYRSIDSALAAIDVVTLAEAARSLGAGWVTVITRIVMPNIVGGVLSAAFVAVALVLGEYTFSSLLHFDTMPVALTAISKSNASAAVAGSLASIILISLLLLVLSFLSRGRSTATIGGQKS
jgi:putative spermidine/putrescine transport system permease protein